MTPRMTYNNIAIPSFIYGTAWKKEKTQQLVQQAIDSGFRAIDTANQLIHYDESQVGNALVAQYKQGITRKHLFLQTKFTPIGGQDHRLPYDPSVDVPQQVTQSFDSSLQHLHTDYIDSYLLHGPYTRRGLSQKDWDVWGTLETLYSAGKTRLIGISNVNADQLRLLCDSATIKPMIVQNRCYAMLGWDKDVREICSHHSIIYQGFSLLTANQEQLESSIIATIADRLKTDAAQILFRFAIQCDILPLTGTTNPQHMIDDLSVNHLVLSNDDMNTIARL